MDQPKLNILGGVVTLGGDVVPAKNTLTKNKKTKRTKESELARIAEIERLFDKIKIFISQGKLTEALDLRYEADKLRINWK